MEKSGTVLAYLNFLLDNEEFKKEELLNIFSRTSISPDKFRIVKEKHLDFSAVFSDAVMDYRIMIGAIKELKADYLTVYFQKKLNVHKTTYSSWKKLGYFKNEFGPKNKRRIPVKDIDEFLERLPKYKELWKKLN